MSWSTIRPATDTDHEVLNKRAREFAERHGITVQDWQLPERVRDHRTEHEALSWELDYMAESGTQPSMEHGQYLRRLWRQVMRRALNAPHSDGIAYGHVGFHVQ